MASLDDYSIDEIWNRIQETMSENPAPITGLTVVYQFDLIDGDNHSYQLHLTNGTADVKRLHFSEPDCTVKLKTAHFKDLLLGRLNGAAAFMTGKLKVKGSIGLAMKLDQILGQYDVKKLME